MQTLSLPNEVRCSMFEHSTPNVLNGNWINASVSKLLERFLTSEGALYQTVFSKNNSADTETSMALDIQIAQEVQSYGYAIADIKENDFEEMGQLFKVFTFELRDHIADYSLLLSQEKEISKKLGLYDRNIILEMV